MADIGRDGDIVVDLTEDAAEVAQATPAADVVELSEDGDGAMPKRAVPQADGSVILPLRFPVALRYRSRGNDQVREERLESLHFQRLTGADMRAIYAASAGAAASVTLARSSRIPEMKFAAMYDRMDAADIDDAFAVVSRFLGDGRKTGR